MNLKTAFISLSAAALVFSGCSGSQAPSSKTGKMLEEGFITPPNEAKPRVWWHWMSGNITEEGIKADLEWMNRVGIGGFHNFDAGLETPQIVKERLIYMTPQWKETYRRMTKMATGYGMEMGIAGSPGWSETGGPWVKPEQGMKKVVWSETDVKGGTTFKGILPQPPSVAGVFQNFKSAEAFQGEYYKDIAVLAIKRPDADKTLCELSPKVTTSGGDFTLADLSDGDLVSAKPLYYKAGSAWIQYEFAEPTTIYSISQAGGGSVGFFGSAATEQYATLEVSNDGVNFKEVTGLNNTAKVNACVLSFEPATGKYFRLYFKDKDASNPYAAALADMGGEIDPETQLLAAMFGISLDTPKGPKKVDIAEFNLLTTPRVHRFIEKAGFCTADNIIGDDTPVSDKALAFDGSKTVDLTSKMAADGSIEWTPEEGSWRILRFGYSLTGKQNSPASPEATGLEVDKFEPEYVKEYLNAYLDMYMDATDGMMGSEGIQYLMLDSWEANCQNWTDKMFEYFKDYRGYDMLRYLPTIAGYVIDDTNTSERFLWDYRKTMGQLITDKHYGAIDEVLAKRGMKRYTESHESQRAFVGDGMEPKKNADIPMAATWTPTDGTVTGTDKVYEADVRESASVAHIYGQKIVAAESLTAMGVGNPGTAWVWSPETLKPTADYELSNGLNRFVLHSTVHQPDDEHVPGLTLSIFGHWFNRHETWAEQAGPWMSYLARSCFMLQQGKVIEDILYFYGEDTNLTTLFKNGQPDMPAGYSYDFVNPDAVENALDVKNGKITTPAGTEYSVLFLGENSERMTMKTLKSIEALVNKGMVVLGDKPVMSPSLVDDEAEFEALASKLWAGASTGAKVGKGAIYSGKDLASVLALCGDNPDCQFIGASENADMNFIHRVADGVHFYWINSRNYGAEDVKVSFKVSGLKPEIWDPVTGKISDISYTMEGENTIIPVHFNEFDSFFIVFREKASSKSVNVPSGNIEAIAQLNDSWSVAFNGFGCNKTVEFSTLSAWNENADSEVKYYSGSAVYSKKVTVSDEDIDKGDIWLNLGDVKNIAEVTINSQYVGELWRAPFRIDISNYIKPGENDIEVKVTNLWVNRIIGDAQPGATKYTYTPMSFHNRFTPLKSSGLIGPVCLEAQN